MNNEYDYRTSHMDKKKAVSYDQQFESNKYRAMIWKKESNILKKIVKDEFKDNINNFLDFACGSGRILNFLSPKTDQSTGLDISKEMINLADNKKLSSVKLIEGDITNDSELLNNEKYDLITAFRFFPNAQQELRNNSMKALVKHLKQNGLLVFNNHKNHTSFIYSIARLIGRKKVYMSSMKHDEVLSIIDRYGLEIKEVHHMGLIPAYEKFYPLPIFLISILEDFFSKFSILRYFAFNIIYVCKLKSHEDSFTG